jgi:hypothetical protein
MDALQLGHEDGFSKIHLASELFSLAEAAQLKTHEMEQMTKLVRTSTKITSSATSLVQEFAQAEIKRLADSLTGLADASDLSYDGEDRDWLLGLTKVARESIQATSLSTVDAGGRSFTDGGLWRRDLGLQYLAAQQEAFKRDVRIQRLFIIDRHELSGEDLSQELNDVLRQHLKANVEVRKLTVAAPDTLRVRLRDFIIFDKVLSYQSTPEAPFGHRDPRMITTTLVTNPVRVKERRREFDDLWNHENTMIVELDANDEVTLRPAWDDASS